MIRRAVFCLAAIAAGCTNPSATPDVATDAVDGPVRYDVSPLLDIPDAPGGVRAGLPCTSDDDCNSALLVCDLRGVSSTGICTNGCIEGAPADEAVACGASGATCLTRSMGSPGYCTRACAPTATSLEQGGCFAGQICTGWWVFQTGAVDAPGCWPFCVSDADCAAGALCDTRTGACGGGMNPSGGQDGTACDPANVLPDGHSADCRGGCYLTTSNPSHGLCASLIDRVRTPQCPDDPSNILPVGSPTMDALGLCILKRCTTDADCDAGLHCGTSVLTGATRVCVWP